MNGIHLVRDPRDAVASMARRRQTAENFKALDYEELVQLSAKQWAFLTTCALQAEGRPQYKRISYEELVTAPDETTDAAVRHVGRSNPQLRADGPLLFGDVEKRTGWSSSPTGAVAANSIGRYKQAIRTDALRQLERVAFDVPEFELSVRMQDLLERFAYDG
jgi:hypothetical protein